MKKSTRNAIAKCIIVVAVTVIYWAIYISALTILYKDGYAPDRMFAVHQGIGMISGIVYLLLYKKTDAFNIFAICMMGPIGLPVVQTNLWITSWIGKEIESDEESVNV